MTETFPAAFMEMTEAERRITWKHISYGEYKTLHTHGLRDLPTFMRHLELHVAPPTNTDFYVRWLTAAYVRGDFRHAYMPKTRKVLAAFEEMREGLPEDVRELRPETTLKELAAVVRQAKTAATSPPVAGR